MEIKAVKFRKDDLPADWKCPRCRQGEEKFNRA